jgi:hypothetical protein
VTGLERIIRLIPSNAIGFLDDLRTGNRMLPLNKTNAATFIAALSASMINIAFYAR